MLKRIIIRNKQTQQAIHNPKVNRVYLIEDNEEDFLALILNMPNLDFVETVRFSIFKKADFEY